MTVITFPLPKTLYGLISAKFKSHETVSNVFPKVFSLIM